MSKFYVSLNMEVEADSVDQARTLAYDIYRYGAMDAVSDSEADNIEITNYSVVVDEE